MPPIAIDPTLAAALPLASLNKPSRVSQNRAALHRSIGMDITLPT